jgi:hypothetical protein
MSVFKTLSGGLWIPFVTDHSGEKTQSENPESERGIDDSDSRVKKRPVVFHLVWN